MLKEIETAPWETAILSPFAGEISAEDVKQLSVITKYGIPFSEELQDAAERGNAILMVNLASDDEHAPINEYLAVHQKEKLQAAIKAVAEAAGAVKILVIRTKEAGLSVQGPAATVLETERNPVLREESALFYLAEKGEVRSCVLEKSYPSKGLGEQPCVVLDGETLCRIYALAKGAKAETKLVVLKAGAEVRLMEVPVGCSLEAYLEACNVKADKGLLLGGVLGSYVGKEEAGQYAVGADALWDLVWAPDEKDCMADIAFRMAREAKEKSCGKCVLCREGTFHISEMFLRITQGKAKKEDLDMILDIGPLIQKGAFCRFGQNMAGLFVSCTEKNRSELAAHFVKKTCPAGVCQAFAKPVINPEKCTGCTDCADVCDEDAIIGKKGFIHMIDGDLCENCGKCADACEEGAVTIQDGTIRIPKKLVRVGKFK